MRQPRQDGGSESAKLDLTWREGFRLLALILVDMNYRRGRTWSIVEHMSLEVRQMVSRQGE